MVVKYSRIKKKFVEKILMSFTISLQYSTAHKGLNLKIQGENLLPS